MSDPFEPVIISFLCNWCSYRASDQAGTTRLHYAPNIHPVRVMCSSRVEPTMVLKAFVSGADGVLVAGCHPGECHYDTGNLYTRRRIMMLKKLLETIGMEPDRLRLEWVSAGEGPKFAQVVNDFSAQVKQLGPSPFGDVLK